MDSPPRDASSVADEVSSERIIWLASTPEDEALAARVAAGSGLVADLVRSFAELEEALDGGVGVLVLAGDFFDTADAPRLLDRLTVEPAWSSLPVVVLVPDGDGRDNRLDVLLATGAVPHMALVERSGRPAPLISAIRVGLADRRRQYELRGCHRRVREADEERARLLRTAEWARDEAESAARMRENFLDTLSHELRTPLHSILGWANLLRSGEAEEDDFAVGLAAIERNVRIQSQIVDDLLDIARMTSGALALDVRRMDFAVAIEAAIVAATPAAVAKEITLTRAFDPGVASEVSGDPVRLQQVAWNLISNAVKFTPRGGAVRAALVPGASTGLVEFRVSDTGQGIAPGLLPHVFERFRQGDGTITRAHGGLGLGLALVRQLVEMHGGTVRAESPGEGLGSTFTASIPLVPVPVPVPVRVAPSPPASPEPEPRSPSLSPSHSLRGLRILFVDDEDDVRLIVGRILSSRSAEVRLASSADEALLALGEFAPHVLLSDIGLPGKDGYELIRRVRLGGWSPGQLPAAAITAFVREGDRERALVAGFQSHMPKPVEAADLIALVVQLSGRGALV